jgi:hypothetical protein
MCAWLEVALEDGDSIPEPRPDEAYSGKFVVRVPKSLRRQLVENAEQEEVSLNQFINFALATSVSEKYTVKQKPVEVITHTWPGLSDSAYHVLRMAGMDLEAGDADEKKFAWWYSHELDMIHQAIRQGYYKEAIDGLQKMIFILNENQERSPVIDILKNTLTLLFDQIHEYFQAQQRSPEIITREQIREEIRKVYLADFQYEKISTEVSNRE